MALKDVFKTIGGELSDEVKELRWLLIRMRIGREGRHLGANFRQYGDSFGIYDFDEYVAKAKEFYALGIAANDAKYTVVQLPGGRVAIDYDGEIRGIFNAKGDPLAYFRQDYKKAGYKTKEADLDDFKNTSARLFS